MSYFYKDHQYLVWAYHSGGAVNVPCPVARQTLKRLGFMTEAKLPGYYGQIYHHGMALTKKGQKRAEEIIKLNAEKPKRKYGPKFQPKSRKLIRRYW